MNRRDFLKTGLFGSVNAFLIFHILRLSASNDAPWVKRGRKYNDSLFLDYTPGTPQYGIPRLPDIRKVDVNAKYKNLTKICYEDKTSDGYATLLYTKLVSKLNPYLRTDIHNLTVSQLLSLSVENPKIILVPLSQMKIGQWGWFWCGGVYPYDILNKE